MARQSELLVYVQLSDSHQVDRARRKAEAAGLDATHLQIDQGDPTRLNLADNVADALIAVAGAGEIPQTEALRVLRPRGRALLGQREVIKPVPDGMDDWSHPYHGPDNNPLSQDRLMRAPYMTQFLADPRYGPSPQLAVASGGRIFKAFGHVAWHKREEPFLNTLVAFNGFNGTALWKRPLPEGLMVHRNTMIATPETLFLGDDKSCKLIDTSTGQTKDQIILPAAVTGGTFWKWMAVEDGILYALLGKGEPMDQTMRWGRQAHGWPWTGISKGYNQPQHPWGFGRNLLALDPKTKKVLWRYHEDEPMDSRAVCMKNGRIFAFRFGTYLTCLDAKSGKILWRKTKENAPELFKELGEYLNRQSWQTNWRTTAYLKCTDRAVYFAGPQIGKLLAVSAEDGRILWQHPYDNFQLIIYDEALYAISGPWGNNVSRKLDPLTGKVLAELPTGRRACTRPTATSDSIMFRAMGGSVRLDVAADRPRWVSPMRPPCHDGVTVANGLLYWWPFSCDCQLTLNGLTSLTSAGEFDFTPDNIGPDRFESKLDGSSAVKSLVGSAADWPTFRANNRRTATTRATIAKTGRLLWKTKLLALPGVRPTAPVTVGRFILLADSHGVVRALDAQTGRERWKAYTGGEIRIPPTLSNGRALVGSGDGWVYAYETATGKLLWRFQAAPVERKIPVYGKLLSTWPAASGVLIEGGTAYVAAGLVNYDGTYVYALDPATGEVKWCNDTSGHLDPQAETGVSVQGHLLLNDEKLYLAGGNAVSPAVYDIVSGRCLNDPGPLAGCESTSPRGWELALIGSRVIAYGRPFYSHPNIPVYDHTVTKKMVHASTGQRDVVWLDSNKLLCYRPLNRAELSRCVTDEKIPRHITQAWGQFKVSTKPEWQYDCPGSIAVAVAKNAVVVADRSKVTALDLLDGQELWTEELSAAPVPWGLAVNRRGNVILTLVDGHVLCIGSQEQRGSRSVDQTSRRGPRSSLVPTHANVRYGPHKRNVLDLYLAESTSPTPLVLYIHGGGFRGGDKKSLNPNEAKSYLESGFSVAAINYRLTDAAPAPAAYLDCGRALQFLRRNAEKWNIDPELVASTGGSAGAGTSMWLAFHDDLADPESDDPIARQSTRLVCIAVRNGQSSYDPRFAEKIGLPRPNFERHPFFEAFYDIKPDQIDTPIAYKRYEQAAPITYLSKDDPPALLTYSCPNEEVTAETSLGLIVHHPKFGIALKEQMDKLGIECIVQYQAPQTRELVRHKEGAVPVTPTEFIRRNLRRAAKRAK
jgi:outer membrane protein assembly factor BamB